jgi:hypothetical protein
MADYPSKSGHGNVEACALEPQDFAKEIRCLAIDAHRALTHPETATEELINTQQRFEAILSRTPQPLTAQANRWLRSILRAFHARLRRQGACGPHLRQNSRVRSVEGQ